MADAEPTGLRLPGEEAQTACLDSAWDLCGPGALQGGEDTPAKSNKSPDGGETAHCLRKAGIFQCCCLIDQRPISVSGFEWILQDLAALLEKPI